MSEWEVIEGDALTVLPSLPDASVDAVITDPPYSSGGMMRTDRVHQSTTAKYIQSGTIVNRPDFGGDNRDQRSYLTWCSLWLVECLRITRPGGSLLMFSDWRQLPTSTDAVQAGGWVWRGIVAWDKGRGVRPQHGFSAQCEYIVWATAGTNTAPECLDGVQQHTVRQADKHHITGKPTDLMRALAKVVPVGGHILDPFAGSGTTGVGALLEDRTFVGVEKDPGYAAKARERLAATEAAPRLFTEQLSMGAGR